MSDIKITPGPSELPTLDAAKAADETIETTGATNETSEISPAATDSVETIAADVAAGRVGKPEAVERIVSNVMGSKMVSDVPPSLRQELESMLNTMLEEDAYLQSLSAAIGPNEIE